MVIVDYIRFRVYLILFWFSFLFFVDLYACIDVLVLIFFLNENVWDILCRSKMKIYIRLVMLMQIELLLLGLCRTNYIYFSLGKLDLIYYWSLHYTIAESGKRLSYSQWNARLNWERKKKKKFSTIHLKFFWY